MARYINAFEFKQKLLEERDEIPLTITQRYSFGVPEVNKYGASVRCGIRKALRCMERTQTAHVVEYEEYERVCKERDVAIADLHESDTCNYCKYRERTGTEEPCCWCYVGEGENLWEWRGLQDG